MYTQDFGDFGGRFSLKRVVRAATRPITQVTKVVKKTTKPLVKVVKKTIDPLQLVTGRRNIGIIGKKALDPLNLKKMLIKKQMKQSIPEIVPTSVSQPVTRPVTRPVTKPWKKPVERLERERLAQAEGRMPVAVESGKINRPTGGFISENRLMEQEYPEQEAQWYPEQEYSEQEYPEQEESEPNILQVERMLDRPTEQEVRMEQEIRTIAPSQGGDFMSYLQGIWNKLIEDQSVVTSKDFVPATRILEGYSGDSDYDTITPSIIDQPMGVFSRGGEIFSKPGEYDNRNVNRPQLPDIVSFNGFGEEPTFWDKLGQGLETIKPAITGVRKIIQGVKKEQQPMTATPIIPVHTSDTGLGMLAWMGLGLAVAGGAYLILKRR